MPPLASTLTIASLFALAAVWMQMRVSPEVADKRLRLRFNFPSPRRANLLITFDALDHAGPFAARATLIEGEEVRLTRDSVDGMPDGEDARELVAPMIRVPLGDNVHRLVGMIGIEAPAAEPKGRIQIEIFDREGEAVAVRACDF